ncbi:MAG: helicase, partial [Planctomycetaceae bacterium]|nr:helicase [Planctomycetaceae bacterium]
PELMKLRGVNPLYGLFLLQHLGKANTAEKIQALESLLELPTSLGPVIRVPKKDMLPNGPLVDEFLDPKLLELGLASVDELVQKTEEEEHKEWEERRRFGGEYPEERKFVIPLAEKLQRLFEFEYPAVDVRITPAWVAGEILLEFNGDFNKYVLSKSLQKQEGVIFRHLLRFILLLEEFLPLAPADGSADDWKNELTALKEKLNVCCRNVDPQSTDEILERAAQSGFDDAV